MDVLSDTPPAAELPDDEVYAPGDSALEVAARRGIGPLSTKGRSVWHGNTRPCVSCGQLVPFELDECLDCGQNLLPEMLERMKAHAGPWYVHEHVRPFPGVTLERLVRQIRRGVLTPTTIVRGPTTDHQWRFAAQTPGLSKHLGMCWKCQESADELESTCRHCGVDLNGGHRLRPISPPEPDVAPRQPLRPAPPPPRPVVRPSVSPVQRPAAWIMPTVTPAPAPAPAPAAVESRELQALSAAVRPAARTAPVPSSSGTATIAGVPAWWMVAALLAVLFIAMAVVIKNRLNATSHTNRGARETPRSVALPPLPAPAPTFNGPAASAGPAVQPSRPPMAEESAPPQESAATPNIAADPQPTP